MLNDFYKNENEGFVYKIEYLLNDVQNIQEPQKNLTFDLIKYYIKTWHKNYKQSIYLPDIDFYIKLYKHLKKNKFKCINKVSEDDFVDSFYEYTNKFLL